MDNKDITPAEPLENEQTIFDLMDSKDVPSPVVIRRSKNRNPVGTVTSAKLNLRADPDFGADVLMILSNGDPVIIEDSVGSFYRVTANGVSGFCAKEFISIK